ncbi:MAG: pyridoxal-phosphate dependent enzyme, partial [Syntrophomonas sp.]
GGTITGVAAGIKSQMPEIQIIGVEPAGSAVLSGNKPGPHKLQGIGAGFIPQVLNIQVIDRIIAVKDQDALEMCKQVARKEAVLVGISSGAAIFAALMLAKEMDRDKKIMVIAPDGAEKYLSTELFD